MEGECSGKGVVARMKVGLKRTCNGSRVVITVRVGLDTGTWQG